jgi:uncharacterized glyoxalase superfamily protein PhnB
MHAEMEIGDSVVMLTDAMRESAQPETCSVRRRRRQDLRAR